MGKVWADVTVSYRIDVVLAQRGALPPGEVRTVQVHRPQGAGTILHEQDELSGEDVVPGFHCRVADLFVLPTEAPTVTA